MVNYQPERLDAVFGALADPTRRAILARLATGRATVTEVARPFDLSLPAITKHLNVLEGAGLIRREAAGRQKICRLEKGGIEAAAEWIDRYTRFWSVRLDALEELLTNEENNP